MLADYHFYHPLRVRYSEIDGQKIVFNAHYLTYLDVAVTEYFREVLGDDWIELVEKNLFDIVLVKTTLEFKRPAKLDQILRVYCRVSRLGNSSFTISSMIVPEKERMEEETDIILTAETIYANYNSTLNHSQSIPNEVRSKIVSFEGL